MSQWVQSKYSEDAEKWEVANHYPQGWNVLDRSTATLLTLPKSEYRPCDPPDTWEDVTERLKQSAFGDGDYFIEPSLPYVVKVAKPYRLRKIPGDSLAKWVFIVERKKP